MPKPNPLSQGLSQAAPSRAVVAAPPPDDRPVNERKPSRAGRVLVGAHFAPEVQTALKIIAAEERTTIQALLSEGINTVFAKRHRPEIAHISTNIQA